MSAMDIIAFAQSRPIGSDRASAATARAIDARQAAELLKALSHETRLLILCLLSSGEKSVSELEDTLNMPQATVSQQLARLRMDGLVVTRREGRSIYYSLAGDDVFAAIALLYDLLCIRRGTQHNAFQAKSMTD